MFRKQPVESFGCILVVPKFNPVVDMSELVAKDKLVISIMCVSHRWLSKEWSILIYVNGHKSTIDIRRHMVDDCHSKTNRQRCRWKNKTISYRLKCKMKTGYLKDAKKQLWYSNLKSLGERVTESSRSWRRDQGERSMREFKGVTTQR